MKRKEETMRRLLSDWFSDIDLSVFGDGYVCMHKLYVNYILYCSCRGSDDVCSDRVFSRELQLRGFPKKYTNQGTKFLVSSKR